MKQKKSVMYIFQEGAAAVAALLMVGFFPLYFQDHFLDMSDAKLNFFRVCAIGLILALAVFLGMDRLQQLKESMVQKNSRKPHAKNQEPVLVDRKAAFREWLSGISVPGWFIIVFVAGIVVAVLFSMNPQESILGREGRKLGAVVWLLCAAFCALLGKYLNPGKWLLWFLLAANTLVSLLAILNFWGIDPLGMYADLTAEQVGAFISTVGNINACAGFLCMAVPAGMALYVAAGDKQMKALSAGYLVIGILAGFCTHSESWILGMAAAFLVLLWFCMRDNLHMGKFLEVCGIFWASGVLMKLMVLLGASAADRAYMYFVFTGSRLVNGMLLNGYVLAIMGILIAGLWFWIRNRERSRKDLPYHTIRKWIFLAVAALAAAGILALIIANVNRAAWEGAFSFLERFRLTDAYGSGRGLIWRVTVESWLKLPLWDKITGCGVNCFHMFINTYGGPAVLEAFGGAQLVDAHNEIMQILATMGLLGAVGYFGFIISTIVRSAKKAAGNPVMLMGILAVSGYVAQSLVNNPTVFLTPYLFLVLAITKSMEKLGNAGE